MWKESLLIISVLALSGCVGEATKDIKIDEPIELEESVTDKSNVINMDKEKAVEVVSKNLFKEPVIMEFREGSVRMKLDKAELVDEYKTSNFDGTSTMGYRKASGTKVMFHISGDIDNDSLKVFSFGHQLGEVRFKLIYDEKHEFEVLGSTENDEGTKTEGASVYSLERKKIHLTVDIPESIVESGNTKSLLLVISANEKEFEIKLR